MHQLDEIALAGDEGAEGSQRLAQRADQQWHLLLIEARLLQRAATRRADHAQAMRVVDQQPGVMLRGERCQLLQAGRYRHPC